MGWLRCFKLKLSKRFKTYLSRALAASRIPRARPSWMSAVLSTSGRAVLTSITPPAGLLLEVRLKKKILQFWGRWAQEIGASSAELLACQSGERLTHCRVKGYPTKDGIISHAQKLSWQKNTIMKFQNNIQTKNLNLYQVYQAFLHLNWTTTVWNSSLAKLQLVVNTAARLLTTWYIPSRCTCLASQSFKSELKKGQLSQCSTQHCH